MDILTYINKMNRLYGNEPAPVRFNTQKYLQGGRVGMKPGGLVEPGVMYYGKYPKQRRSRIGGSTEKARKYLNNLSKGSTINRQTLIKRLKIDPSALSAILNNEFQHKNFKFKSLVGVPEGTLRIEATKKEKALGKFLFGKPWDELSVQERTKIIKKRVTKDTITDYRRVEINKEYDPIAKKLGFKKPYSKLDYNDQRRVRAGEGPAELLKAQRIRAEDAEKRIVEFQKKFIKENGRLPSQQEYRTVGNFDINTVKKAVDKNIIRTLPLNLTKGLAGQQAVYKDLVKLADKESVRNIFRKGKPTATDINVVANALGTKDKTLATRRLYQLASAFANEIQVPGIKPKYVTNALKIMDESRYNVILRSINELQIGKSVGEKSIRSIKSGIRQIPTYIFSGDYNIDEPAGVQSSVRRGSTPYGIFGQVIRKDLNMGEKHAFDSAKSVKERLLKQAILEGDPKEIDTALKNFNDLVADYEKKLNVDTPKGAPKIRLFRASLDSPEVTIKNFASFNKEYQKSFMDNFKTQGYSFQVPKDIKTIPQIKEAVQNPNTIKRMTQLAKAGAPRLLSTLPGVFGAGAVGAAALLHGTSTEAATPKKEVTKSSMIPKIISENPYTSAAVGTGAALTQKPVRSLLGKVVRTLGTPLAGPAFAAWTASDKMKAGESLADAVIDPLTGAELAIPTMFKENLAKIAKNPTAQKILGLGKFGTRFLGPIGWGIAGVGAVRDAYKDYQRRKPYIEMRKEQIKKGALAEEQFDEDFTTY